LPRRLLSLLQPSPIITVVWQGSGPLSAAISRRFFLSGEQGSAYFSPSYERAPQRHSFSTGPSAFASRLNSPRVLRSPALPPSIARLCAAKVLLDQLVCLGRPPAFFDSRNIFYPPCIRRFLVLISSGHPVFPPLGVFCSDRMHLPPFLNLVLITIFLYYCTKNLPLFRQSLLCPFLACPLVFPCTPPVAPFFSTSPESRGGYTLLRRVPPLRTLPNFRSPSPPMMAFFPSVPVYLFSPGFHGSRSPPLFFLSYLSSGLCFCQSSPFWLRLSLVLCFSFCLNLRPPGPEFRFTGRLLSGRGCALLLRLGRCPLWSFFGKLAPPLLSPEPSFRHRPGLQLPIPS